jgi:hypothetical protein
MPPITGKRPLAKNKNTPQVSHMIKEITGYCPERFALAPGYYSFPSQQNLFASNGKCDSLIIGNHEAVAYWPGGIDLSTLALPLA